MFEEFMDEEAAAGASRGDGGRADRERAGRGPDGQRLRRGTGGPVGPDGRVAVLPPPPAPPADPPVSWVEPPADLVALWEEFDARYGEPDPSWGFVADGEGSPDDFALVEQVAAFEASISWARAQQLAVIAALAGRASMNPSWPVKVSEPNITGVEIAARLGTSRQAGRALVSAAVLCDRQLYPTADALHAGHLDWVKAQILIHCLKDVPGQVALLVQDRVLPAADRRTPAQLRADIQRALIAVDPADAQDRTDRAVTGRRVCKPKVLPDGMAGIWAVLPAAWAIAIDTALRQYAHLACLEGDPRTVDQIRADTFTDALLTPTEPPRPAPPHEAAGANGDAEPAAQPDDADARSDADVDADVDVDADADADAATATAAAAAAGVSERLREPSAGVVIRVDVTVGLTTLLGLDEQPGELTGYGPITAQTARRLALHGTWRRLLTDPRTGTVLDVGKHRYRPPADLAEIVRARDRHCLSPVCGVSAHRCELDHRVPFRPDGTGGSTSSDNLGALCKADHLLKTHAGWRLTKDDSGTYTWTTPTGHTYPYRPDPAPGHERPPTGWDEPARPADGTDEPEPDESRNKPGVSGDTGDELRSDDDLFEPPPF